MRDKYLFVPLPDPQVPDSHKPRRDEMVQLFAINKDTRKQKAHAAEAMLRRDLAAIVGINQVAVHQALHGYEKEHLLGGGNITRLTNTLKLRYRNALRMAPSQPGSLSQDCFITVQGAGERKVGTIEVEEDRFTSIGRPALALNEVYVRKGDPAQRHYVRLTTSNIHVKRFVTRGLSAFDGINITAWRPLRSVLGTDQAQPAEINVPGRISNTGNVVPAIVDKHAVVLNALLPVNAQIITHTRGWGGNKRFISTGVSNRPALSTRGQPFVSMYGVVTVDLALVPLNAVYDVHRHDTASAWLGLPANDILINNHHTGTADLAEQRYLALRDTIRTRELLIKGTIPLAALKRTALGRVLLGVGSLGAALHNGTQAIVNALPPPVLAGIVQQDHMDFVDPHSGRRWHFIEFNNAGTTALAAAALPAMIGARTMEVFEKFSAVRPTGMV
jgi:hypothetical protein